MKRRVEQEKATRSEGEELFALHLRANELSAPEREHRFHDKRKWRFDFAWPSRMLAVEIEGGTFSGGRHVRGLGYLSDCQKYNAAVALGWMVFRFTTEMVKSGEAIDQIKQMMRG